MNLDPATIRELLDRIEKVLRDQGRNGLVEICRLLRNEVAHYDWVGFYMVDVANARELVLGPYTGEPTEHTHISFGHGICGQAADTGKLFLIQDVSKETNYLSCSPHVRSEIVLPIFRDDILVGELDIDSHSSHPFTEVDTELLEEVCRLVSDVI